MSDVDYDDAPTGHAGDYCPSCGFDLATCECDGPTTYIECRVVTNTLGISVLLTDDGRQLPMVSE